MRVANAASPRLALAVGALALALAGAAGVTQEGLFQQPSSLKYGLTILGPLLVVILAAATEPLRLIVPLTIVAAPLAEFESTFHGIEVSVIWPLLALGVACALATHDVPSRRSTLGRSSALIAALLAIPVLLGGPASAVVTLLAAVAVSAWLASHLATEPRGLELVIGSIVASALLQAVLALVQLRTGKQFNLYSGAGSSTFGRDYFFNVGDVFRPTGGLADPIALGNVLALGVPASIALTRIGRTPLVRLAAVVAGAVITVGLTLTLSRMSWFGAIAGVLVTVALLPRGRRLSTLAGIVAVGLVSIAFSAAVAGPELRARFASALAPTRFGVETAQGDRERLRLWAAAIDTAEAHPISGVGMGNIRDAFAERGVISRPGIHAHSTYLQIAAEAGLLGLCALAVALSALATDIRRTLRASRALGAALAGAATAMLVFWITDYAVGYLPVGALIGFLFGAAAGGARRPVEADSTTEAA
jgi:O-antigen ligase